MFKKGDKVVCIDDQNSPHKLIKDNIYTISITDGVHVYLNDVTDEYGDMVRFLRGRFILEEASKPKPKSVMLKRWESAYTPGKFFEFYEEADDYDNAYVEGQKKRKLTELMVECRVTPTYDVHSSFIIHNFDKIKTIVEG